MSTKIQELNHKIKNYLDKIILKEIELQEKSSEFKSKLESFDKKHKEEIQRIQNLNKQEYKVLSNDLEYLNAEIDRYSSLLNKFYEANDFSPEMKIRFQKLKKAVSEYVNHQLEQHLNESQKSEKELIADFQKTRGELLSIQEIQIEDSKTELLQEIIEYENFAKNDLESKKGTCPINYLVKFDTPSFENLTDSILIGNTFRNITYENLSKNISIPFITKFIDSNNLLLTYDEFSEERVEAISDVLIFRILFSHVPDKIKIHIFDKSMSKKFKEFLPISTSIISKDFELEQFEQKLMDAEKEIRSKLTLVYSDVEADYASIYEYNLKMIKEERYDDIVPYYLFVIDDLQDFNIEKSRLISLTKRLQNLTNNGCNALFMLKTTQKVDKSNELIDILQSNNFELIDLRKESNQTIFDKYSLQSFEINNLTLEDKKTLVTNFNFSRDNLEVTRAKLKFKNYALPAKDAWFNKHPFSEVSIPIGKSQTKEGYEKLTFNTKGMLSSAMLCGGVGSGKTNFLKSVITSLSLEYSPEELEMWLVDLKNGAGFSVFYNCKLPHATKYAFSAENELINDMLFQLNKEMERRSKLLGSYNVENISDAFKSEFTNENEMPKRILLIIDEFSSIFSEETLINEITTNLMSIAQKGRALGINFILSAQNFDNVRNSVFDQIKSLIPTRILLKSSPSAANSVLGYRGNEGFRKITKIGEGLINNNFGEENIEGGNNFFKSFLLDNEDLEPILESINQETQIKGIKTDDVKFIDASVPAVFANNIELFNSAHQNDYESRFMKFGVNCFLGESYLLNENNHFSFQWKINGRHFGQNILICGNERVHSSQSIFSVISSLTYGVPNANFCIKWLNVHDEEYSDELKFNKVIELLQNYDVQKFTGEDIEILISGLENIQNIRRDTNDKTPIIVLILGIERIFKLLRTGYSENELGQRLSLLISTSSNLGIYFVIETTRPSNLEKISRNLIDNFDHRICYHLNVEESRKIVENTLASKLIDSENPEIRNKALYYSKSESLYFKFKSYQELTQELKFVNILNSQINLNYKIDISLTEKSNQTDSSSTKKSNKFDTESLSDEVLNFPV